MLNYCANGPSGYNLTNSLRFRSSASAYLNRTPASATNRKTWTWSGWVKRSKLTSGEQMFFSAYNGNNDNQYTVCEFNGSDNIVIGGYFTNWRSTSAVYRDPSAWYHIVIALDTTQATAANRLKLYVNGSEVTAFSTNNNPSQNSDLAINQATSHNIAYPQVGGQYFDGYMTEINFIDGQALTPSSFGSTNALTGVWQPKQYTGTYGTNGFYLNFSNIALTSGSNTGLGKDYSGNGNYWNTNNISVTSGTTYDAMTDVPTLTSATVANYAVLNPLNTGITPSNANLTIANGATSYLSAGNTFALSTGKYYYEVDVSGISASNIPGAGFKIAGPVGAEYAGQNTGSYGFVTTGSNAYLWSNGSSVGSVGSLFTNNIQVAIDYDAGKMWFGYSNTWLGGGSPSAGTSPTLTFTANTLMQPVVTANNTTCSANFGQRPFVNSAPTGFVAINAYNLPDSTIVQGNKYMDATLYAGNGSSQSITNTAGFKPDLVWIKDRTTAQDHNLFDSVRGTGLDLFSNKTDAQANLGTLTAFNSNGFTVLKNGGYAGTNASGSNFVGWQWQANQGTTVSGTGTGGVTSVSYSANTTSGFSIVQYTETSTGGTATHGLGVAPSFIITKDLGGANNWNCYHVSLGATKRIQLNSTAAADVQAGVWNNTAPTSTVFTLGNSLATSGAQIAYCWAEIAGFSKFGSYTGNGSTDGTFVYTGFRPKYILIKNATTTGQLWFVYDTSRSPYNLDTAWLAPNNSNAEAGSSVDNPMDILSNGFKNRYNNTGTNTNGDTYIYAAFAENPFKNALAR